MANVSSLDRLPGPVYGIVLSPNFEQDATLFAVATDWETGRSDLYRSRDAGASWARLSGGLPGPPNDLIVAPDGRLYAALTTIGWRMPPEAASEGAGVYVSDDRGESWRPDNAGLTHLRVGRLHADADGVLYARAAAAPEPEHVASGPTIWTRPPGQDWELVSVPEVGPLRLVDYAIPTTYTLAVNAYWHEITGGGPLYLAWDTELRRSDDGGETWRAVGRGPAIYAADVLQGNENVYWIGPNAVWRSSDEGKTWAALDHPLVKEGLPFTVSLTVLGDAEILLLGTEAGRVSILPVTDANWKARDP
jgi:photosystem II stability/assembly factor-like uncharacterized protein